MKIDTTKPIETVHGKAAVILMVLQDNSKFPIIGKINDNRVCSWDYEGNPSTNMGIDKIRNSPIKEKIPITFEHVKNGVLLRNASGTEIYMPLKCHSAGVTIVFDDSRTISYLTYEELVTLGFYYRPIGAGLRAKPEWKPCYDYRIIPVEYDEEEEEDEDD